MAHTPRHRAYAALLVARAALAIAALVAAGCDGDPPAAVCGNGVAEDGEDGDTCCVDAGCAFGSCTGAAPGVCREDWQEQCLAGAGTCAGPFVCGANVDVPPAYDCTACPCPGADACYEAVCTDAATREEERVADEVAEDLDMTEYARFFRTLTDELDAIPVAEAALVVAAELSLDSRTTAFVAGADAGVDVRDLDDVVGALLAAAPFGPRARVDLRERRADACDEVQSAAQQGLLPDNLVVALVPDDAAARATCAYPGTFPHCDVPLAADCALLGGRRASTVVVIDQIVALRALDRAVMLRAGLAPPDVRDSFLTEALSVFDSARNVFPLQEGFRVANRFAGAFVDVDAGIVWVVLADPNARAEQVITFRLVWNDPLSQQYMIEHDIQARDCAFDPLDGGLVLMTCDNAGFRLTATVDPGAPVLVDVEYDP